jgi:hypothetical protein
MIAWGVSAIEKMTRAISLGGSLGVSPLALPSLLRSSHDIGPFPGVTLRFTPGWQRGGPTDLMQNLGQTYKKTRSS